MKEVVAADAKAGNKGEEGAAAVTVVMDSQKVLASNPKIVEAVKP
ncbi:hypothetical protein [Sporisorium scitamineum]|uniref:Uncharacterized protein n=1 Tax=Sporisorium scitamineum TaxID=49012 RepID=A0A0F7SD06_9BASI|nr:hypothetical protein [Sporisorium scitamineum]